MNKEAVVAFQQQSLENDKVIMADLDLVKASQSDTNELRNELRFMSDYFLQNMKKKSHQDWTKEEFNKNKNMLRPIEDLDHAYKANLQKREPETGQWIFSLSLYKSWHESPESGMLWLSGGPGKLISQKACCSTNDSQDLGNQFSCL
jgi:hypothetical protein